MRWIDLLGMPLASLGQQKMRTCLTTLGVLFGAFVLAASLSINEGVQQTIERESSKGDVARKVTVSSKWRTTGTKSAGEVKVAGRMTPERRERIRKVLAERNRQGGGTGEEVNLTPARLDELAHESLMSARWSRSSAARSSLSWGTGRSRRASRRGPARTRSSSSGSSSAGRSSRTTSGRSCSPRCSRTGSAWSTTRTCTRSSASRCGSRSAARRRRAELRIVSPADRSKAGGGRDEQMALRQLAWQIPGRLDKLSLTPEEVAALRKVIRPDSVAIAPAVVADNFRVVGIFRELDDDEKKDAWSRFPADTDLVLPRRTAVDLMFRDPARREEGINQAILFVDDMKNVKEVVDKAEALGLSTRSAVNFIERERLTYLLIFGGMTCVAAVALLVSSLGIANTMLMSVLERRREIGIMKAVGAADWQLQALFVIEGGLIGLIGGALGLLLAWSISFPGDAWVRSMVHRDMKIDLSGSIFAFPSWIGTTVVLVTVGVTVAAGLYPARHAAKVDPVTALRHD